MARIAAVVALFALLACAPSTAQEPAPAEPTPAQQTALDYIEAHRQMLIEVNQAIWEYAEVGLEEVRSSRLLVERLREAGFEVEEGVANMPTAFVASYGSGDPVIGILAEYDALPGMSQAVSDVREPYEEGAAGHACGHSGFAAGSLGAALAVREAIEQHGLQGTIRLYGTPAEETGIGKVYMLLAGLFDDLDVCLHWHPATENRSAFITSKAVVSVKFRFRGIPAHASANPESGRSALDAVELMNVGVNYMREHVAEDARFHYVITDGGGQPNVVPPAAEVWYYIRANEHGDVERYFEWIRDIAQGAALMTRTELEVRIETDNHEVIPNRPLSELVQRNFELVGPPQFTDEERLFARRLQQPLVEAFGSEFPLALAETIDPLPAVPEQRRGSTDVGDISWHVPTGGLSTACFVSEAPGHSWQNVATIGSSIGHKGLTTAAQVLALTAIDLMEHPELVAEARADFEARIEGREYTTLIPEGQTAPRSIR